MNFTQWQSKNPAFQINPQKLPEQVDAMAAWQHQQKIIDHLKKENQELKQLLTKALAAIKDNKC